MTTTTSRKTPLDKLYGKFQNRYLELMTAFPLRAINTDAELDAATEMIHSLIDLESRNKAEDDYLDVLTSLVEAYESVHEPVFDVADHEMLSYLMELKEVSQVQVAKEAKIALSTISELLSGKRKLTRGQIGKLARYFQVAPGTFSFSA